MESTMPGIGPGPRSGCLATEEERGPFRHLPPRTKAYLRCLRPPRSQVDQVHKSKMMSILDKLEAFHRIHSTIDATM